MAWNQALDGVTPGLMLRLCVLVIFLELSVFWTREVLGGCGPFGGGRFPGSFGFCNSGFLGPYHLRQSQLIPCLPLDLFPQL